MNDEKKDTTVCQQVVPSNNSSTDASITQHDANGQAIINKNVDKSGKRKTSRVLYPDSKTRTIAIKCYEEQMPFGLMFVGQAIRKIDKKKLQIILYIHNRDIREDSDIFVPSIEKPHAHIIARGVNKYEFYVKSFMSWIGIYFRDIDKQLWANRGVETCGDFTDYAVYGVHQTKKAIDDGGKFTYDLEECYQNGLNIKNNSDIDNMNGLIFSNLTLDEIKQVFEGYVRVEEGSKKLTQAELIQLDADLFELGYNFGDLEDFIDAQPFNVRSHAKRKTLEESYYRGVNKRLREVKQSHTGLNRLCVFIQGGPGTGKTYASVHAFAGKRILQVEGGGSGKFDDLKPSTEVVCVNDDVIPNALNICDDYPCKVYRRNSNNQVWTGRYLIVTSNLSFRAWLEKCHIDVNEHYDAMYSRFFHCHIEKYNGKNMLKLDDIIHRGDATKVQQLINDFADFQDSFNAIITNYVPANFSTLDMSRLNASLPTLSDKDIEKQQHIEYDDWCNQLYNWHYEDVKQNQCPVVPKVGTQVIMIPNFNIWLNYKQSGNYEMLHTVTYINHETTYHG